MRRMRIISGFTWAILVSVIGGDAGAMTLEEAVEMAREQNHMLRVARAKVEEARGSRMKSYAGFLPSVRVTEGWFRSNDAVAAFGTRLRQEQFTQADFDVARLNFPEAITNWQTRVVISQPIFNGGMSIAGRRAAGRMVSAAEAELIGAEIETRFKTVQAYWGVVLAKEALAAVKQGLASARSHAATAEAAFREETISLADLLASRVRVAELEAQVVASEHRVAQAEEGLTLVTGQAIGVDVRVTDRLSVTEVTFDLADLLRKALTHRPDLIAAERRLEAASAATHRARGRWIPHVNAFFEGQLNSDKMTSRLGESWTAGAVLSWDLFSGGKTLGEIREASARRDQAREGKALAEAVAEREVQQAVREVRTARRQIAIATATVAQAEERLRVTALQFREGLAAATDVLDAEAGLTRARLRHVKAMHDLVVGQERVRYVTGGDH